MNKLWVTLGCMAFVAIGCQPVRAATDSQAGSSADATFKALYTREWNWRQAQFDRQAGPHGPDHLPRIDPATQAKREHYWADVLDQLKAIPIDDVREAAHWWAVDYNEQCPHGSLGDLTPVEHRQQFAEEMSA